MIGVVIVAIVFVCVLDFLYGYSRGMDDLKTIENWGIGFDQGWKAAMEFMKEKKESEDAADEDDEEALDEEALENDRYNQEQDWLENHGRELE